MKLLLIIIPCGSAKRSGKHPARDLYCGNSFKANLRWAESVKADIIILSAKHGLIEPTRVIKSYNVAMGDVLNTDAEPPIKSQAKAMNLRRKYGRIIALGGKAYREALSKAIDKVEFPLVGKGGIGKMAQILNRNSGRLPEQWTGKTVGFFK